MGGVKTNDRLQSIDRTGAAVPNLYVAGADNGSTISTPYCDYEGTSLMTAYNSAASPACGCARTSTPSRHQSPSLAQSAPLVLRQSSPPLADAGLRREGRLCVARADAYGSACLGGRGRPLPACGQAYRPMSPSRPTVKPSGRVATLRTASRTPGM